MSTSHENIISASKTLVSVIWNSIKDDKQLKGMLNNEKQITLNLPNYRNSKIKEEKNKGAKKATQLSIYLFNVSESLFMRNQPSITTDPTKPRTLLYLTLHYLITPTTGDSETDQLLLGKIIQILAEKPILRVPDLQDSLCTAGNDLRLAFQTMSIEELSKLWTMLGIPCRLCVNYTLSPVRIEAATTEPYLSALTKVKLKGKNKGIDKKRK